MQTEIPGPTTSSSLFPCFRRSGIAAAMLAVLAGCGSETAAPPAVTAQHAEPAAGSLVPATTATPATARYTSLEQFQQVAQQAGVVVTLPTWETTPDAIGAATEQGIAESNALLDAMAALADDQRSFSNSVAALDAAYSPALSVSERLDVIRETSTDEAMRDAAFEATKRLQTWFVESTFREDVYRGFRVIADSKPELQGEDAMLLKEYTREYRRNGMDLPKEQRDALQKLKTELDQMELEFHRNVNQADILVEFTAEELDGVSQDFLDNPKLKTERGTYQVNANVTWQVIEILENARSESTRERLSIARSNRAKDTNLPLFSQILAHRSKIAQMLGYTNWADYRTEPKMAKNAATALEFETRLRDRLTPKFEAEIETLRQLKVAETGDADARIRYWDALYYQNQLKKTKYQIDTEQLKNFFELNRTLSGMFSIFEEIFQLHIDEIDPGYKWIDDLKLFAVSDAQTGAPLGLIYMDMFPREGKYNHFAQFGVSTSRVGPDGRSLRPVVALICNFPPPVNDKPSLLSHDQVETLFHEFGHSLHSVLTQARYATFSGTSVPRDFVEAPSQMLENWVRDKTVLDRFAVDYRDGTSKIPAEVLDQLEAARIATTGLHYRRQLAFGLLDLAIHTSNDPELFANVVAVTNEIMSEDYLPVPPDTAFIASFSHLGGGYDAGYYGYAWADAISADMASVFRESPGKLMDPTVGRRLRDEIYAPGGSREIEDSIQAFLGRPRSLEPFLRYIGLQQQQG